MEYLLELRSAQCRGKINDTTPDAVGDVVLVHDSSNSRGFW